MAGDKKQIMWLLRVFDDPRSSYFNCYYRGDISTWRPETEEEKRAFAELTLPKNRDALKSWYAGRQSINEGAEVFRQILQKAVNEELPLSGEMPSE